LFTLHESLWQSSSPYAKLGQGQDAAGSSASSPIAKIRKKWGWLGIRNQMQKDQAFGLTMTDQDNAIMRDVFTYLSYVKDQNLIAEHQLKQQKKKQRL